jgi:diguanylate cyclase (GGDEF)-like protein
MSSMSASPKSRLWMVLWSAAIGVLVLAQGAVTLLVPRGFALTLSTDLIGFLLMLSAMAIFLRNALAATGRLRVFWALLASCWGTRLAVHAAWMYFNLILRQEAPNPFAGDILFFLSNIPVLAALLLDPPSESTDAPRPQAMVDFSLLLLWWLYLYLFFVVPWQYVALDPLRYGSSYNLLNSLLDLVLLLGMAFWWQRTYGAWRLLYGSLFGAQLCISVSGYLANRAIDQNIYYPGSLYDLPYTAALACFTVVGLLGSIASASQPVPKMRGNNLPLTKLGILALLSLPVITGWSVLQQNPPLQVVQFRMVVLLSVISIMAILVVTRQWQLTAELAKTSQILQEASVTDPLTGIRNRRFFEAAVPAEASGVLRVYASPTYTPDRDLIFYVIDLDNFKEVNDRYGHAVGDKLLIEVTRRISAVTRKSDMLVRWGGDEFLIVSRASDRAEASVFASRILQAVGNKESYVICGHRISQTCSIGWAAFPWNPDLPGNVPVEAVLGLADRAAYEAKAAGKNRAIGVAPSSTGELVLTATAGDQPSLYPVMTLGVEGPPQPSEPEEIFVGGAAVHLDEFEIARHNPEKSRLREQAI